MKEESLKLVLKKSMRIFLGVQTVSRVCFREVQKYDGNGYPLAFVLPSQSESTVYSMEFPFEARSFHYCLAYSQ